MVRNHYYNCYYSYATAENSSGGVLIAAYTEEDAKKLLDSLTILKRHEMSNVELVKNTYWFCDSDTYYNTKAVMVIKNVRSIN